MSYFHVLAEVYLKGNKEGRTEEVMEFDKPDLEEIRNDIVLPYIRNQPFVINGFRLDPQSIKRFIVTRSEQPIDTIVDALYSRLGSGVIVGISTKDAFEDREFCKDITKEVIRSVSEGNGAGSAKSTSARDLTKVFIVHGHDELAKTETARFVEKLGMTAIILHERESEGRTIMEKIEAYSNVGFGIVLYTPDDLGGKADNATKMKARARQNVIFEHGYLIGKLGRKAVVALVKGDLEKPNDISGVVYIEMDSRMAWQLQVAKEMKMHGCPVDLNKL